MSSTRFSEGTRIETSMPVHEIVEDAFRDWLEQNSVLADSGDAEFELRGFITKFDSNNLVRREAHFVADVILVRTADSQPLFQDT